MQLFSLSSAKKRAIYDQFGEEGLKGGVPEKGMECIVL